MLLGVIRGPAKGFSNCSSTHGAPPGEKEEKVQGRHCGLEGDQALSEVYGAANQEAAFPTACQKHRAGVRSQLSNSDWRPCCASGGR